MTVIIAAKTRNSLVIGADSLALIRDYEGNLVAKDNDYQKIFYPLPDFAVLTAGKMIRQSFTEQFFNGFLEHASSMHLRGQRLCVNFGDYAKNHFEFEHPDGNVEFLCAGFQDNVPFIARITSIAFRGNPPYWVGYLEQDYIACGMGEYPEELMNKYGLNDTIPTKSARKILKRVFKETSERYPDSCGGHPVVKTIRPTV